MITGLNAQHLTKSSFVCIMVYLNSNVEYNMQTTTTHSYNNAVAAEYFLRARFAVRVVYGVQQVGGNWAQLIAGLRTFCEQYGLVTKDDLTDSKMMPDYSVYAWNTYVSEKAAMLYTSVAGNYEVQLYVNDEVELKQMLKDLKAAIGFELRKRNK